MRIVGSLFTAQVLVIAATNHQLVAVRAMVVMPGCAGGRRAIRPDDPQGLRSRSGVWGVSSQYPLFSSPVWGVSSQYPLFSSPVWGIGPASPALRRKKWG